VKIISFDVTGHLLFPRNMSVVGQLSNIFFNGNRISIPSLFFVYTACPCAVPNVVNFNYQNVRTGIVIWFVFEETVTEELLDDVGNFGAKCCTID
jgi:hypothetical protein